MKKVSISNFYIIITNNNNIEANSSVYVNIFTVYKKILGKILAQ